MSNQHPPTENHPRYSTHPVSYMRRGTRLQGRRQTVWDTHADSYVIDVPREFTDTSVRSDYVFDPVEHFGREAELVVEIGSGLGEAVVHLAAQAPEKNFLAVEVYKPGLASTLGKIAGKKLSNVRVVEADAVHALERMLPAASVTELYLFFPDPWHKKRHHKRRLVRDSFVPIAARVLKPGGVWRLATDWSDYAEQMRDVLDRAPQFENPYAERASESSREEGLGGGWAPRYEGRVHTSFENKAHRAGRRVFDLEYVRR
ncbi:tRNA (guanosine(46)-N7)-methyltransferase TrmB [Lysinibacter sp. HNR]|uniref:tRNA (guanosine(46)-N7)-methyltransferase TrmB n=1 Tax=Lysinibacter sp. HNR TaxID=3031408 RepID=UPI002434DBBE|nr:tRNA (guanosine(46)-N7)-methyltransferase TrmB [Lysinibacter sp. HNR]WGD38372.1 tRNA (guanosine(46)-N7)-methyltransferase TrmB [Lysinibacter sp. HNR]